MNGHLDLGRASGFWIWSTAPGFGRSVGLVGAASGLRFSFSGGSFGQGVLGRFWGTAGAGAKGGPGWSGTVEAAAKKNSEKNKDTIPSASRKAGAGLRSGAVSFGGFARSRGKRAGVFAAKTGGSGAESEQKRTLRTPEPVQIQRLPTADSVIFSLRSGESLRYFGT